MGLRRNVHPETLAAIAAGGFHSVVLVLLDWPGGILRLHSGSGVLAWDGEDWLGVGPGQASARVPAEVMGMAAAPMTLRKAGLPPDIWDALEAPIRNRDGALWMAASRGRAGAGGVIGAPIDLYGGYMDASRYVESEGELGPVHCMEIDLKPGPGARVAAAAFHSYEQQMAEYPGDTGMRLTINGLVRGETLTWPA